MPDWQQAAGKLGLPSSAIMLRPLSAGPLASAWLLDADGVRCVLRLDHPLAKTIGLDRRAEWRHLQLAFAAGLGPEPLGFDAGNGALLTAYLDGEDLATSSSADVAASRLPERWAAIGQLLRRLHELPAPGAKAFDPLAIARRYASNIDGPAAREPLTVVESLAAEFTGAAGASLCHNDIHLGNVLACGGKNAPLKLIDWEYAAAGSPVFDLVVPCRYHRLEPAQVQSLCAGWGDASIFASEKWRQASELYDALSALWTVAVHGPGKTETR